MLLFEILKKKFFSKIGNSNVVIKEQYPNSFSREIPSLELNLKGIRKSENGLYPHEILILGYASKYKIGEIPSQGFWLYKYGVKETKDILDKLYSLKFITESSITCSLENLTINTLKDILKKYKLKVTGKKEELVNRLLNEVSEDELLKHILVRSYSLTELGQIELDYNDYVMYIHKNEIDDLNIWTLNKLINKHPEMNYRDIIWKHLNQQSLNYFSTEKYGLYRNTKLKMVNFLVEDSKNTQAIPHFGEVIAIDLNNLYMENSIIDDYDFKDFFPYEESFFRLLSSIVSLGNELIIKSKISNEEAKEIILEHLNKLNFKLNIFSNEECIDLFLFEKDGDIDNAKIIYENKINEIIISRKKGTNSK